MRGSFLVLMTALIFLTACAAPDSSSTPSAAPASSTPTPTPSIPTVTPEPRTLTVWLPDWMLLDEPAAAANLQKTVKAFGVANGVDVEIVIKQPQGSAGLLETLTTSHAAAPAVLPDLIALNFADAATAAQKGLLQPLGALISPTLQADLYPFAQTAIQTESGWYAVPFAADFEHLAYQPSALSEPPLTWNTILESQASYAFPTSAVPDAVGDGVMLHYMSAPKAIAADGAVVRDENALRQTLSFYETTRKQGITSPDLTERNQPADTWRLALSGDAALAHTTGSLWLKDKEQAKTLRFGPIPAADGQPRFLVRGWTYAIVTADAGRQALAAALIETLLEPETLSTWSQAAHQLPTRRTALALWPADNYTAFADEALASAMTPPPLAADPAFANAVNTAVIDVLSGASDANAATRAAVSAW